ncbi:MAG: hypothetical protein A2Y12_19030 [Planctomycetes bacterium GWF2_42_9]|nr:MAG: hypothetical protein A2Y12_19030 [Planctomycetes bacterium GWF2_42_9]HAL45380.1 hypothetical protein [Phycisphaerales bacterium]
MESIWYYVLNNQQCGPVDEDTIQSLIQNGSIRKGTLVWKAGMQEWQKAEATSLEYLFSDLPPVEIKPPIYSAGSFQSLWLWLVWMNIAGTILVAFNSETFSKIAFATSIVSAVIQCVLIYRFWAIIQDGKARTTPGYAVGLCFIPIFHIYWTYIAYVCLAENINSYCNERKFNSPRVDKNLALIWYVLFLVNHLILFVPNLWYFTGIPSMIIGIIFFKQFVEASKGIIFSEQR